MEVASKFREEENKQTKNTKKIHTYSHSQFLEEYERTVT